MHVIDFLTGKLLHKGCNKLGIINFENLFQNLVADTMNWFQNSRSGENLLCNKAYRNQNFMVTWIINLEKNLSRADISDQFKKVIMCHKRIGYNINVM